MDHFDPLTMQYLATPTPVGGVEPRQDFVSNAYLPLDMADHGSDYGGTYTASEYGAGSISAQHNAHMNLKRFSSGYEDPFSDVMSAYDPVGAADSNDPQASSIDRDNKLLGFSLPIYNYALLDYTYQRIQVSITAQLHGMFFLAESPWGPTSDPTGPAAVGPPAELTCYRRNLFQISGSVTLPRRLRYVLTEQNEQIPIIAQELTISATESVEGNAVKIISVPWKTPAANASGAAPEEKIEKEPPAIQLDLVSGQEQDPEFATFSINWKRLQFRIATANNGRRKELQQHFVVRLKLVGTLSTGQKVALCEVNSGAIIVRGRSPRNFQSRKEFPVGGAGSTSGRKGTHSANMSRKNTEDISAQRAASIQNQHSNNNNHNAITDLSPTQEPNQIAFSLDHDFKFGPDLLDWKAAAAPHDGGAMTALPADTFEMPHGLYAQSSPDLHRRSLPPARPALEPINLSLIEDESRPPLAIATGGGANGNAPKALKTAMRAPSFSLNPLHSPDESADLLYEYFPLGLDDWMPPVDAVYRPHVVHHLSSAPETRAEKLRSRSKRYFSEDHAA